MLKTISQRYFGSAAYADAVAKELKNLGLKVSVRDGKSDFYFTEISVQKPRSQRLTDKVLKILGKI